MGINVDFNIVDGGLLLIVWVLLFVTLLMGELSVDWVIGVDVSVLIGDYFDCNVISSVIRLVNEIKVK